MCLGIPMKIIDLQNDFTATAETLGVKRSVRIDIVRGVKVGDYVLVHAGFAMEIIDQKEARERVEILGKMLSKLEEVS